jgi:hypothetical protein
MSTVFRFISGSLCATESIWDIFYIPHVFMTDHDGTLQEFTKETCENKYGINQTPKEISLLMKEDIIENHRN